jgi:hypothetical protein
VQAPLGLILLGLAAVLTVLFRVFLVFSQASTVIEARRYARELRAQRELAEQAETSRFTELRSFLEAELLKLADQTTTLRTEVQMRLEQVNKDLRSAVEQVGNTLAAYIGEIEDRMERAKKSDPTV